MRKNKQQVSVDQMMIGQMVAKIITDLQGPVSVIIEAASVMQRCQPQQEDLRMALISTFDNIEYLKGFCRCAGYVQYMAALPAEPFLGALFREVMPVLNALYNTALGLHTFGNYSSQLPTYREQLTYIEYQSSLLGQLIDVLNLLMDPDGQAPMQMLSMEHIARIMTWIVGEAVNSSGTPYWEREIRTYFPQDLSQYILANPAILTVAVRNYIDNALKFSYGLVEVSLIPQDHQGYARITVTDFGRGISKRRIPGIWQQPSLSMVKTIVERIGGGVDVQSSVGQGTTFAANFPWAYS